MKQEKPATDEMNEMMAARERTNVEARFRAFGEEDCGGIKPLWEALKALREEIEQAEKEKANG